MSFNKTGDASMIGKPIAPKDSKDQKDQKDQKADKKESPKEKN